MGKVSETEAFEDDNEAFLAATLARVQDGTLIPRPRGEIRYFSTTPLDVRRTNDRPAR